MEVHMTTALLIFLFPLVFPIASIIVGFFLDFFLPGAGSLLMNLGLFLITQAWWWFPVGHITGFIVYAVGGGF